MDLHYIDGSPFAGIARVLALEHDIALNTIEITEFPPPDGFFELSPLGHVPRRRGLISDPHRDRGSAIEG
jgi:glutathione S-transferase